MDILTDEELENLSDMRKAYSDCDYIRERVYDDCIYCYRCNSCIKYYMKEKEDGHTD